MTHTTQDWIPARDRQTRREHGPVSTPLYTLAAGLILAAFAVFLIATGKGDQGNGALIVAFVVTTLPSLFAAGFAERTSRDVRNGVIVEKARQGTVKALTETGVTDAIEEGKQTTPAALAALTKLLAETDAGKLRRTALSDLLPDDPPKP